MNAAAAADELTTDSIICLINHMEQDNSYSENIIVSEHPIQ